MTVLFMGGLCEPRKIQEAMDPFGTKYYVLDEGQEFWYRSAAPMSILWDYIGGLQGVASAGRGTKTKTHSQTMSTACALVALSCAVGCTLARDEDEG